MGNVHQRDPQTCPATAGLSPGAAHPHRTSSWSVPAVQPDLGTSSPPRPGAPARTAGQGPGPARPIAPAAEAQAAPVPSGAAAPTARSGVRHGRPGRQHPGASPVRHAATRSQDKSLGKYLSSKPFHRSPSPRTQRQLCLCRPDPSRSCNTSCSPYDDGSRGLPGP